MTGSTAGILQRGHGVAIDLAFEGFSPRTVDFLAALAANNERAWFQARKAEYERLVKRPLEALCSALAERFAARGLDLVADPARSPFRIYRDTRFSRDKSPYKPYASARFPLVGGGPGAYFHLGPGEIFAGGGLYHPEPRALAGWRRLVASGDPAVHAALDDPAFVAAFGRVDGDRLTRVPAGYPKDHPDAELLKLKDIVFSRPLADADVRSPALPDLLTELYATAMPLLRLLGRATTP